MKKISLFFVFQILLTSLIIAQDANTLIANAQVKAKASGKKVMVKYTATWCVWCHKMDTAMADPIVAKYFNSNYEVVRIHIKETKKKDSLNTPGGEDLYKTHTANKEDGIPFWVVLDETNKVLANSRIKAEGLPLDGEGSNAGCPVNEEEVGYFLRVLKATGKFGNTGLRLIKNRFKAIK